ncbi:MAG: hypothetical protein ABFD75_04565 [Smithella sp.]
MMEQNILTEMKNSQLPVVIAGAGIVGKVLLSICEDAGIRVECFCDSSEKVSQSHFCDKEVIYAPDLRARYDDAVVLISVAAIKDVVDLLNSLGFSRWYAGGPLLKEMDISQNSSNALIDYTKFAIENCILCHDGYLNPDKIFLRSIDIIITERCSLRCKDCSNLMQYYKKPKDCDIEVLMQEIDAFCSVVDDVMDFRIIGGDVFMSRHWPLVVKRLVDEPKGRRIVLYTNGTIVPKDKDIACLVNKKILVIASDYGPLSAKMGELVQVLEKNKIAHHILEVKEWLDCAAIAPHNRSQDEQRNIFRICCAKNMCTLSNGKLFRCPYAANTARLSAVPDNKSNYVDLMHKHYDQQTIHGLKNDIKEYLLHKDFLEICDFCNGRPLSGPEVQPAVQIDTPLPYHRYDTE